MTEKPQTGSEVSVPTTASTHLSLDALLPPEMARAAEAIGARKAKLPPDRLLALGVLAGAFISLGALLYVVVTADARLSPGVGRLLGGLAFSLGLILVIVGGAELFTGNNLMVMALASRRITLKALLKAWALVYAANFVGAISMALIVYWSGHTRNLSGVGERTLEIATTKANLDFVEAIILGVLANILVCLAVWLALSARSVADKILAIVFPITAFVAAGFEHSIANMYFMPSGLFLKMWAPAEFWMTQDADRYEQLTWARFFLRNLLPVTIGNVIGGAALVGLVYWFIYRYRPETEAG